MNRITNKHIMEKMRTIKDDVSILTRQNNSCNKEIIEKINTMQNTVNKIQNTIADKDTMRKLFIDTKKSVIMIYAALSIAFFGIGFTLVLASLEFIALQYGIIFSVFFGGSIILAYFAYIRKKELILYQ